MSKNVNTRENFMVPSGNLEVWQPTDGDFSLHVKTATGVKLKPAVGQVVILDSTRRGQHVSVDLADLQAGNIPNRWAIAVVCRKDGVRKAFSDRKGSANVLTASAMGVLGMDTCNIKYANAMAPKCGQTGITDFYFGCIECDTPYTIRIGYEDDTTREQFPHRRRPNKTITVTPKCDIPCTDDCTQAAVTCDDLLCKFFEQLNQGWNDTYGLKKVTPQGTDIADRRYVRELGPIKVHKLYEFSQYYCLPLSQTACDGCGISGTVSGVTITPFDADAAYTTVATGYKALKDALDLAIEGGVEATITAAQAALDAFVLTPFASAAPVTTTFAAPIELASDSVESQSDRTRSLNPSLDALMDEVNAALDGRGAVTYQIGTGSCCDVKLEINACVQVELVFDTGAVSCSEIAYNFDPIEIPECQIGCTEVTPETWTPCGIRVITDPVLLPCDCENFPANQYIKLKTRYATIEGLGFEQWACKIKQQATLPINSGYQLLELENDAQYGGDFGRAYKPYNEFSGRWGKATADSRVRQNKIDCKKGYCTMTFKGVNPHDAGDMGNVSRKYASYVNTIAIPVDDTVTQASVAMFLAYFLTAGCCNIEPITCDEAVYGLDALGAVVSSEVLTTGAVTVPAKATEIIPPNDPESNGLDQ